MIALRIEAPYASFRKSYARSFAESYPSPPPATVYGLLLSLVGEQRRARHAGARLAFAYGGRPQVATTLRKLSRYKYGVASRPGNVPDYVETLCDVRLLCFVDSAAEPAGRPTLEQRITQALERPEEVTRSGVLYLGLSDDAVDDVSWWRGEGGPWYWLTPAADGPIELPVWVDHVGSLATRWRRYRFAASEEARVKGQDAAPDRFVEITVQPS